MAVTPVTQPQDGEQPSAPSSATGRSGDMTCTAAVESDADTVDKIIEEVATSRITEREATRA